MKKLIFLLPLVFLLVISIAFAEININENLPAPSTTAGINDAMGEKINASTDCTIKNVTKHSSATATNLYIWDESCTLLANETFSGDIAVFDFSLEYHKAYWVMAGVADIEASWTRVYSSGASYPQAQEDIVYVIGAYATSFSNCLVQDGFTYNILSITTDNSTASPAIPVIESTASQSGNPTSDTTPTVNATTDIAATCNISTDNSTWIGCSTTGDTIHICTINESEAFTAPTDYANVTFNCTAAGGSTYGTIVINITDSTTPNIDLQYPDDSAVFELFDDNTFSLNFTATDDYFTTLDCNLTINGVLNQTNSSVISGATTSWEETTFAVGSYDWNVSCMDGHRNVNSSQRSFTVNNTVYPIVSLQSPADGLVFAENLNNTLNLSFIVTDENYDTVSCNLTINGVLNQTNSSVISSGSVTDIEDVITQELSDSDDPWFQVFQSFTATTNYLTNITVNFSCALCGATTFPMRIYTNESSPQLLATSDNSFTINSGYKEYNFEFSPALEVDIGTTYRFGVADIIFFPPSYKYESSDVYPGGKIYKGASYDPYDYDFLFSIAGYNDTIITTYWDETTFAPGDYIWNTSCIDAYGNANNSQRSFSVVNNSCEVTSIGLYLDGLNESRKYEFGSWVNLTANYTATTSVTGDACSLDTMICLDIDAPNAGVNVSCRLNNISYIYNITTIRQDEFNNSQKSSFMNPPLCFQEQANESTSCGGLNTGQYASTASANAAYDSNYSTSYTPGVSQTEEIYINYSKPLNAQSVTWYINGSGWTQSIDIVPACFNQEVVQVRIQLRDIQVDTKHSCWSGSGWTTYGSNDGGNDIVFEDSVLWAKSKELIYFNMDNRTDITEGSVNISGIDNPDNITMFNSNTIIATLPGFLNGTYLTHDTFYYSGIDYSSTNITYTTANTEVISIDMSASGNRLFYNITFQLTGFDVDLGNDVDYTQYFNSSDDAISDVDISTADNVEVIGEYDNFERNTSDTVWEPTILVSGCNNQNTDWVNASDSYFRVRSRMLGGSGPGSCDIQIVNNQDGFFDLKNFTLIEIDAYVEEDSFTDTYYCTVGQAADIRITDGTNDVIIYSSLDDVGTRYNFSLEKVDTTTWKVYRDDISQGTYDLSPLTDSDAWYLKFRTAASLDDSVGGCVNAPGAYSIGEFKIYRIQASGLWANKTVSGTEFTGNGSICMDVIANTSVTNNYTAVTVIGNEYKPDGTDIKYTISADNLTSKQLTVNDLRSVFITKGNLLTGCVNLSGTNESSPIVYDLRWLVVPTTITDVSIDAGNDGTVDWNMSGVLNSTTSPWNVTIDQSSPTTYSLDYASNNDFLFPMSITTGSAGLLQVSNIFSRQNPNPIIMNVSLLETCVACEIGASFSIGLLNFTSLAVDFLGSINYTALAHLPDYSKNDSHDILVKYSKFNFDYPFEVTYYEPYPIMSRNDKNITPYGQEINYCNTSSDLYCESTSIPIFNVTYDGYDEETANFTISINGTQSGVEIWAYAGINRTSRQNITITPTYIMQINKTSSRGIWSWTDLFNASLDTIYNFEPNITIEAYCSGCLHNG